MILLLRVSCDYACVDLVFANFGGVSSMGVWGCFGVVLFCLYFAVCGCWLLMMWWFSVLIVGCLRWLVCRLVCFVVCVLARFVCLIAWCFVNSVGIIVVCFRWFTLLYSALDVWCG